MEQGKNTPSNVAGEALLLGLMIVGLALITVWAGLKTWFPPLASEHGVGVDRMINYTLVTTGSLFLIGHVVLGYCIWKFGRQKNVTFRMASFTTEKRLTLIPVIIMAVVAEGGVLVLGLPVWAKLYGTKPTPEAITIEITAEQFAWNVRYPGPDGVLGRTEPKLIDMNNPLGRDEKDPAGKDDIVLLNAVHVPVNRPVSLRLRAKDVLHSFFLPNFRLKQDLVPGMTIEMGFMPTHTGRFEIACAELCGFGHYQMRGLLYVKTQEEYDRWLKEQQP